MRVAPLAFIVLAVLLIGTTVGTTFLWVIAGIAIIALIVLIVVMARAQSFVGPRVIVDDIRDKFEAYGQEPEEVQVEVVAPIKDDK